MNHFISSFLSVNLLYNLHLWGIVCLSDSERIPYSSQIRSELKEIYQYRTMLIALVKKDLIGRYRHSFLGFFWHFVSPLMLILIYYIAFSSVKISSIDNFGLYVAIGVFPFNFMLNNLISGSNCIINNGQMINKMYFPNIILVLSQVISSFVVFLIGIAIVSCISLGLGLSFSIVSFFSFAFLILLIFIFAFGLVLLFSSICVYVKDVQLFLTSISTMFFFLTPMFYLADETTGILNIIIWINPFTYFVEGFHQILFWGYAVNPNILLGCIGLSILSITAGMITFYKLKNGFAQRV